MIGFARRPAWGRLLSTGALMALLLAGCGTSSGTKSQATSSPKAPDGTPTAPSVCTSDGGATLSVTNAYLRNGNGGSAPEGMILPDDLAPKPQVLTDALGQGHLSISGGTWAYFDFGLPPSGQTGYICAVTLGIESFTPLSVAIPNVTATCIDPWMAARGLAAIHGLRRLPYTSQCRQCDVRVFSNRHDCHGQHNRAFYTALERDATGARAVVVGRGRRM